MTIASTITAKLEAGLAPVHLEVVNESGNHNVPPGSESHFKVTVVSDRFEGMPTLHRHRAVYGLLAEELAGPVHALALHTYTGAQWRELGASPGSPQCRGGARRETRAGTSAAPTTEPGAA